jgi:ornithine carbamoyltransferase
MKKLVTILDLSLEEILSLIDLALFFKRNRKNKKGDMPLKGKIIALIFEKPSTRTRLSFEAAMYQLGGQTVFLTKDVTQLSREEPIKDTARVLSAYVDAIVMRTYTQKVINEVANWASISVINALSDEYHPTQVLSDLLTVKQYKGGLDGLKIAWLGDGNNVANSWINAAIRINFFLYLACPKGYEPKMEIVKKTKRKNIVLTNDPIEAIKDADVVNTDVWMSMGEKKQKEKKVFYPYQINQNLLGLAKPDVIVMHCLPSHRGEEITEEVIEGPKSVVFKQAENKLYMAKAILKKLLG